MKAGILFGAGFNNMTFFYVLSAEKTLPLFPAWRDTVSSYG